jgi:hypothetical protein
MILNCFKKKSMMNLLCANKMKFRNGMNSAKISTNLLIFILKKFLSLMMKLYKSQKPQSNKILLTCITILIFQSQSLIPPNKLIYIISMMRHLSLLMKEKETKKNNFPQILKILTKIY